MERGGVREEKETELVKDGTLFKLTERTKGKRVEVDSIG